jgi:hypothetical protein
MDATVTRKLIVEIRLSDERMNNRNERDARAAPSRAKHHGTKRQAARKQRALK